MPSQILMTSLASTYLNQFAARPDQGTMEVPVLLQTPEGLASQPVALDAAIDGLGEAYFDQIHDVILGVDEILGRETIGSIPATDGRWGAVRSMKDELTTFYRHGPGPRSMSVGLSPERNGHRLKVKIVSTTSHSEMTMEQVVRSVKTAQRLVCDAPRYALYLHKFAVAGLRHYLGLSETMPLGDLVPTLLDYLGVREDRRRGMDALRPVSVTDPSHIHEIGYTAYKGLDGHQSVLIEGALHVGDLEEGSFEEWLNIDMKAAPAVDRKGAAMKPKMLEIWNLPNLGLYSEAPSDADDAAYRRLTARIYSAAGRP